MTYSPFLIANYATGYDRQLQPWLLPNDAFIDLLDGYVYRGVTNKRDGYSGFAQGLPNSPTESRMIRTIAPVNMTGTIDGTNRTFTATLTSPVSRGSVTITGSNPSQVLTDDGLGSFTGAGTGTINYTTGAVSITFTTAPIVASTVTITYDYFPGFPVMGIMNFYPTNNVRQLIVADTTYVNRYNTTSQRLTDISSSTAYNGTRTDFWSWVNYADASSNPRLLFCNGVTGDVIQKYDGSTVAAYAPTFTPGTLNARQMFNFKDRLVLFQTIENNVLYPRRIRISGTGANCDNFDNTATGAGFIDIPDNTWFFGAAFNRDDLLFFTESSTWSLKFTGNDVTPFTLSKLDGSRGSASAFSVISYLNRTMAASPRGLIICDGYQVDRMDNNIPAFSYDDIDGNNFQEVYSGFIDEDRDVYTLYPSKGIVRPSTVPAGSSDRILVTNFEEDNYAIYRIPLSCMGNFQSTKAVLWADLTSTAGYGSWDALSSVYSNWNAFPFTKGTPIAIGGGHKGEIWELNTVQGEDNPVRIRNITVIDANTVRVTTDWNNYSIGDYIVFEDVLGMTRINHRQGFIENIPTPYNVFDVTIQTQGFNAYSGGGIAARCVPFEATTKQLNPWVDADKKVRCGWIYFYVSVAETILKTYNSNGTTEDVPAMLTINVILNDTDLDSVTNYSYQVDCSNLASELGTKKWVKIWINQTARFLQFKMTNNQAGAKIKVHAMMPGLQPVGRLV